MPLQLIPPALLVFVNICIYAVWPLVALNFLPALIGSALWLSATWRATYE